MDVLDTWYLKLMGCWSAEDADILPVSVQSIPECDVLLCLLILCRCFKQSMQLCYVQVVLRVDQLQLARLLRRANDDQKQDQSLRGMYVFMLELISFVLPWELG